jgi:hypothetical protein
MLFQLPILLMTTFQPPLTLPAADPSDDLTPANPDPADVLSAADPDPADALPAADPADDHTPATPDPADVLSAANPEAQASQTLVPLILLMVFQQPILLMPNPSHP